METLCDSRWDIGGVPCRLGAKLLLLHTRNQLFSCATPGQLCHLLPLRGYMVSVRENACLFAAGMTDKPPVGPFGRPAIKRDYTMANQHITMPAYQHINRLTDGSSVFPVHRPKDWPVWRPRRCMEGMPAGLASNRLDNSRTDWQNNAQTDCLS